MKFVLLTIKSTKPKWVQEGLAEYLNKIEPLQKIEMIEVSGSTGARENAEKKKKTESRALLGFLKEGDLVWLFDEKGQTWDSMVFSKQINRGLLSGKKRIVFIVGGAFGVDSDLIERASYQVSLAPFVMNHWVAQLVSLEQIYRGLTILKGLPYHNS